MNNSNHLLTLVNLVYNPESAYSFSHFFNFLSNLPDLQEDKLEHKSDAEILDMLVDYERVYTKLFQNQQHQLTATDVPRPPKRKLPLQKDHLGTGTETETDFTLPKKTFPRFFEGWYCLCILSYIVLMIVSFSNNNFSAAFAYFIFGTVYVTIYFKLPQRAFTTTFIFLTVISFVLSSFSLATTFLTNPASVDTGMSAYPLAIKIYFCIALSRITYHKQPLKQPLLTFAGLCVLIVVLLSFFAVGFAAIINQTNLSQTSAITVEDVASTSSNDQIDITKDVASTPDSTSSDTNRYTLEDISKIRANMVSQTMYSGNYDSDSLQEEYRSGSIPHMLDDTVYYDGSTSDK